MEVGTSLLNKIKRKQLLWYGNMRRMDQDRLPWKIANRKKKEDQESAGRKELKKPWRLDCDRWKN